jgi:putative spermidine/putrescine transport system ATP-binding protein
VLPAAVARAKGEGQYVAIRADRLKLQPGTAPVDATSLSGITRSVEYLGSTVQVGIDVAGLETLSAVVPEARFDAHPVVPGPAGGSVMDAQRRARPGALRSPTEERWRWLAR